VQILDLELLLDEQTGVGVSELSSFVSKDLQMVAQETIALSLLGTSRALGGVSIFLAS
jgi:hypothetical protein